MQCVQNFIIGIVILPIVFRRNGCCCCCCYCLFRTYLSSGDRVVVVIVLSVMSMNSPDPISGSGVVLWDHFYTICYLCLFLIIPALGRLWWGCRAGDEFGRGTPVWLALAIWYYSQKCILLIEFKYCVHLNICERFYWVSCVIPTPIICFI